MKRMMVLLVGALMMSWVNAQTIQENEMAILYYSPKTTVVFQIQYTEEHYEKGLYSAYAEELLGISDAIKENQTHYAIEGAKIQTLTEADYSRPHKVTADPSIPTQLLSVNEKNLLVGYNIPYIAPKNNPHKPTVSNELKIESKPIMPYQEEFLDAKSRADEAQLIAKQIFRIRETRMYLLSGEVEHAPADGQAMKLVLAELERQEKQLVGLFTGQKTIQNGTKTIEICPTGKENVVKQILYFSKENGFTDAENIDAEAVKIGLVVNRPQMLPAPVAQQKGKKKEASSEPSSIVYNIPGSAEATIDYRGERLCARTIPIAQLGVDMPLAKDLFLGEKLPTIVFSEKTGNVVSISK